MITVEIQMEIEAPPETVFDLLADGAEILSLSIPTVYRKYAAEMEERYERVIRLAAVRRKEEDPKEISLLRRIEQLEETNRDLTTTNENLRKQLKDEQAERIQLNRAISTLEQEKQVLQKRIEQLQRQPAPAPGTEPAPPPSPPVPVGATEIQATIDTKLNELNDLTQRARDATGEAANDLRRKKRDVAREIEKLNVRLAVYKRPPSDFNAFVFTPDTAENNPDPLARNDAGVAFQQQFQLEMAKPLTIEFHSLEGRTYARASVRSARPNVFWDEKENAHLGSYMIRFYDAKFVPITHRTDEYVDGWGFEALATFPTRGHITMRVGNSETGRRYDLSGENRDDFFLTADLFNKSEDRNMKFVFKDKLNPPLSLYTEGVLRVHLQKSGSGSAAYRVLFVEATYTWVQT